MAEDTRDTNQSHGEEGNPIGLDSLEQPSETLESEGDNTVKSPGKTDENVTNQTTPDLTKHEVDTSNLHYEGNACIYTDPATKYQYIWNSEKNEWEFKPDTLKGVENSGSSENEVQNKASENVPTVSSTAESNIVSENEYDFDGESYCHTDPRTGITYKYDNVKNKWIPKNPKELDNQKESDDKEDDSVDNQKKSDDKDNENKDDDGVVKQDMTAGLYGYEGDTHTYTDAKDGTVYIWDREKNAWFPKVDEDFLAHYQMNYGFTDTSVTPAADSNSKVEPKKENTEDISGVKRKAPQEPSWFEMDDQHNTKVYVSNLPLDITEQEFVDLMQKCGLVMKDADKGKMKIKLYTEPGTSYLKGDGLCTYIKIESVDLALKLLDGYVFRGNKLNVERAKFQMKGSYDPNLKPKKKRKKDKEKLKKIQEKLFDWRPDKLRGERSKHESVVIVKNLFDPSIFDKEVSLILEYQQELREECIKCGVVKRVIVYDRHPEGVAQVTFKEPEAADACVALLNGRWFGKRKITAETWDGKTKYKVVETEEEKQQRIQKWEKFLESEAGKSGNQPKNRERFSPIKTDVPDSKNKKAGKTISENTTNGKLNKHEVMKNTEVEKTDKCDVESSSDFLIEEDTRSSAGSSDDTDDEGSKAAENG